MLSQMDEESVIRKERGDASGPSGPVEANKVVYKIEIPANRYDLLLRFIRDVNFVSPSVTAVVLIFFFYLTAALKD